MTSKQKVQIGKDDLRKLMKEKKLSKKIDHPLSRYNNLGQLTCITCNMVVKSELIWNAHLQSKSHKQMTEMVKAAAAKRQASSLVDSNIPEKKKLTQDNKMSQKSSRGVPLISAYEDDSDDEIPTKKSKSQKSNAPNDAKAPLPSDFFDSKGARGKSSAKHSNPSTTRSKTKDEEAETKPSSTLPEGFFDDPVKDAMVRQVPYKDKLDDEFQLFQKAINEVNDQSEQIIENEDDTMIARRNLDEIEEEMHRWSEINKFEIRKEELAKRSRKETEHQKKSVIETSDSGEDDDLDPDQLDWRLKKN